MTSQDFVFFALQIAIMLTCALVFGHMMRQFGQPSVLGEMIGGIILGPTVFGALAPTLFAQLFNASPNVAVVRDAAIKLGMLFFLFIAGLEVNLSDLRRLGRQAVFIGLIGTLLPIGVGILVVYLIPIEFWGESVAAHRFAFAVFIGMNLANSANPVIARILMDLGLLKHEIGTLIMTATIFDDLINWALFAFVLNGITPSQREDMPFVINLGLVFAFFVVVLVGGRQLAPRVLPRIKQYVSWPSGFIAVTTILILVVSSVAEGLGVHAFFGAFLVGAALGSTSHEYQEAHLAVNHFVLSFFVPIYFVSMGMSVNFAVHFDLVLVILIVFVAFGSKIGAVLLGARLSGMAINRQTLAIAFGLNARGATGIILAGVGLENRLIDERIFVAVVVMALITSLVSAPTIKYLVFSSDAKAFLIFRKTAE